MRFLVAASLLGLVGVSATFDPCVVKNGVALGGVATAATSCITVQSANDVPTNILGSNPVTVPIPPFDVAGAILDAIYVNWIDAVYSASGTFSVSGGDAANFVAYATVPTPWGLHSDIDSNSVDMSSNTGNGGLSVGSGAGGLGSSLCSPATLNDGLTPTSHNTVCKSGQIQKFAFVLGDDTFASSTLHPADGTQTLRPDYSLLSPLTYVAFDGPASNTATSGTILTQSPSNAYASAWNLITDNGVTTTPAKIAGSFTQTASTGAGTLALTFAHQLNLIIEIQYDYHMPAVGGDPQFAGFQGQNFQVHGAPESYFALISAPQYYVNARFDYLSTGKCDYNETQCFTHPGTYMGLVYIGMKDAGILVQAGPHATGFAAVLINDKPMQIGERFAINGVSAGSFVHMISPSKLHVVLDTIDLTITNSDLFVNFDLALTDKQLLSQGSTKHVMPNGATPSQVAHNLNRWYGSFNPLHGLIGQTWRNVKYNDGKLYQGDVTEYQLDKIVDHTFLYCVYEA